MTTSKSVHLKARGLHQSYDLGSSHLDVLRGVDLEVSRGEVIFLRGPSGAGKSTLLYILAGLEHPRDGTVEFEGEQLFALKSDRQAALRNRRMGFVFQSYFLLPELTAIENVMLPAMLGGKQSGSKARSLLDRVGLADRLEHLPSQLSGGEQQRVAIARALLKRPKLVLADEPTGELDSESGAEVYRYLRELRDEHGSTVVIVTHDRTHIAPSDHVLTLRDGKLAT